MVNPLVDPTWRFMTLDWDGKIRMDCSSPSAMASLAFGASRSCGPTVRPAAASMPCTVPAWLLTNRSLPSTLS